MNPKVWEASGHVEGLLIRWWNAKHVMSVFDRIRLM